MLSIEKILFGYDFSRCAAQALPLALDLSEHTGAELHVVFAEVLHPGFEASAAADKAAGGLQQRLNEAVEAAARQLPNGARPQTVHTVVRDIAAGPALLEYARDQGTDLIILGTHGRRGLRHFLLGSVAEEVVRLAPCPVLTVRERPEGAAVPFDLRTVTVPIDFSEHAREALRQARELASLFGARLDLIHSVDEELHPAFYNTGVFSIYDIDPDIDRKAEAQLKQFDAKTTGPEVETHYHVVSGKPARAIVHFAEEHETDLIVLSTHGLTGLDHYLLGSVAERIVRRASCPVLTVKSIVRSA